MKEMILDQNQMNRLRTDCEKLIEQDKKGCDIRTLLKEMYCSFYTDKTDDIGYVMADKVISLVKEYDQEVAQAREDLDTWYNEKVQKILEGQESCTGRCNMLYKVRIGLSAAEISALQGQEAAETYVKEHTQKAFTTDEATDELEEKLKAELKDTLGRNGLLVPVLDAYAENAENSAEDVVFAVIRYGEDASRFKAVLAMKAYLETGEDGYLNGVVPEEASLRDITYSVCAGMDAMSVSDAVGRGEVDESEAAGIVRVIGMVIGGIVALNVSVAAGVLAATVAGSGVLAIIGGAVISAAVLNAVMEPLMEAGGDLADTVKDIVCFGAVCIGTVGKVLFSGIRKLAGYILNFFKSRTKEDVEFGIDGMSYTEPVHEGELENEPEVVPAQMVLA